MKKGLFALLLVMIVTSALSAVTVFQTAEQGNQWDLASSYPAPSVGSSWNNGYGINNFIGLVGVRNQTHPIKFTVFSNCKFVSSQDQTKFRAVSLYFVPRFSTSATLGGSHTSFLKEISYDTANHTVTVSQNQMSNLPSLTASGSIELYTPITDSAHSYDYGNGTSVIGSYWLDTVLVMPTLNDEEKKHMVKSSDYILTVNVNYECLESGCQNPDHFGGIVLLYNGLYESTAFQNSYAAFVVVPNADANSLDIDDMVNNQTQVLVGEYLYSSNYLYNDSASVINGTKIFASSSSSYIDNAASTFRLKKEGIVSSDTAYNSVPLIVTTRDDSAVGSVKTATYDGTDYYSSNGDRRVNQGGTGTYTTLAFPNAIAGNSGTFIAQTAKIYVSVPATDPLTGNNTLYSATGLLAGSYKETIYFHIVVE